MNIEHAFWEATGTYEAFEGICLVDTFETAANGRPRFAIFNEANTERVDRQRKAPIKVIIANPPYNAGQVNENDNNKNRKYEVIDRRIQTTYARRLQGHARPQTQRSLREGDSFRRRPHRQAGVVCYVNNDSFIAEKSFDGMRKHLAEDFDLIYVLELGGNVRKNPTLSGTTHNVFGIQVGVSINLFIRLPKKAGAKRRATIHYHAVPVDWRRGQKYDFLEKASSLAGVKWRRLRPDEKHHWLTRQERRRVCRPDPHRQQTVQSAQQPGEPDDLSRFFAGRVNEPGRRGLRFRRRASGQASRAIRRRLQRRTGSLAQEGQAAEGSQAVGAVRRQFRAATSKSSGARPEAAGLCGRSASSSPDRPFARSCTVRSPSMSLYNQKGVVDRPGPVR